MEYQVHRYQRSNRPFKGLYEKEAIILIDEMESTGFHAEKKSIANSMKRVITEKSFLTETDIQTTKRTE